MKKAKTKKDELSLKQLTKIVKQLSPSDRMKLSDAIWDDRSNDLEIPEEHQKLVLARVKRAKQNPDLLVDWNAASRRLR